MSNRLKDLSALHCMKTFDELLSKLEAETARADELQKQLDRTRELLKRSRLDRDFFKGKITAVQKALEQTP